MTPTQVLEARAVLDAMVDASRSTHEESMRLTGAERLASMSRKSMHTITTFRAFLAERYGLTAGQAKLEWVRVAYGEELYARIIANPDVRARLEMTTGKT
jgi:hypothetical protein